MATTLKGIVPRGPLVIGRRADDFRFSPIQVGRTGTAAACVFVAVVGNENAAHQGNARGSARTVRGKPTRLSQSSSSSAVACSVSPAGEFAALRDDQLPVVRSDEDP